MLPPEVRPGAVQLGDVRMSPAAGPVRKAGRDAADGPVFVDESGRRSRTFRRLGMAVAVACAVYAVVIVATLMSGSSDAPWLPVSQHPQGKDKQAGKVESSPTPEESGPASGTGGAVPAPGTTVSGVMASSPAATASGTGSKAATAPPGASATPSPTATGPASGTAGGAASPGAGTSAPPAPATTAPGVPAAPTAAPTVPAPPTATVPTRPRRHHRPGHHVAPGA
ncbi:hypothetical protein [Streptomyces sp. NPDC005573]|uniref:hypothetical protein n=1 Tax=Streptomyces sp. NPDC005573 TaxID=3156890 RepID=UPI0033B0BA1A